MEIEPQRGHTIQKVIGELMQTSREVVDVTDGVLENRYQPTTK